MDDVGRHRRLVAAGAWLALLAVLGPVACGDDGEAPTRVVTEADGGTEVRLESGDALEVRLESNPSTGYAWQIADATPPELATLEESAYVAPDDDLVGSPGTEVLTFVAGEGAGVLRLEYVRSFDDPIVPDRVVEYVLVIGGAEWPPPGESVPPTATAVAPEDPTTADPGD